MQKDSTRKIMPLVNEQRRPDFEQPKSIGRYVISEVIGKGGMGIVYKGEDPYIKRPVAIKVTIPEASLPENEIQEYRERFFTEAQAAGALVHPNIVAIYDAGLEGDKCYIAMEFVDGSNLSNFCSKEKLLPLDKVITITARICEALDFAHLRGVIHRDIKPANVMITRKGIVKVTDFGIARLSESEIADSVGIVGSPGYMAPELLQYGKASVQSDVFSVGVTIYELLAGEQPFKGESIVEIIRKVINEDPKPIHDLNPGIPDEINKVVMGALAKSPVTRYQGSMEFLLSLKAAFKEIKCSFDEERGDERIKYMKALRFFRDFRDEELAQVLQIGTWFHYKQGSMIVKEDERDNNFFIVIMGQVQVERQGRVLALIERGNCFGEMAAFSGQKRTASIVAAQDSVVVKINAGIIDNLSKDLQIRFYKRFIHSLISRLDSTSELLHQ